MRKRTSFQGNLLTLTGICTGISLIARDNFTKNRTPDQQKSVITTFADRVSEVLSHDFVLI